MKRQKHRFFISKKYSGHLLHVDIAAQEQLPVYVDVWFKCSDSESGGVGVAYFQMGGGVLDIGRRLLIT